MEWKVFYNPLAVLGKRKGFAAAVLIIIVLTAVAWWGWVRLDGALDLHAAPGPIPAPLIISESLIAWLSLGLLLFAASKVFGGNGGAGAHLAAVGLSRFPYILAAIIAARQTPSGKALREVATFVNEEIVLRPQVLMSPAVITGMMLLFALMVWSVAILYLGYKEAGRMQSGRTVGSFLIGVVLAEIISKLLILGLFRMGYWT